MLNRQILITFVELYSHHNVNHIVIKIQFLWNLKTNYENN